ncbi:MAG: phosphatase PAP2 family protein [Prevotella sp.]
MQMTNCGKVSFAIWAALALPIDGRCQQTTNTFSCEVDNYLQFTPTALTYGLNIAGVEGRSSTARLAASSAMSYALMVAIAQPIKNMTSKMRPDRSTDDAFPSGHTATAFVGASILHKEYGTTVSPWFSVAGYGSATATGLLRVMKNRHWTGDVLAGAGIGIAATEIAYALSDLLFNDKGLRRSKLPNGANAKERPSFIGVTMGMGFGGTTIDFSGCNVRLKSHTTMTAGVEAAHFFTPYIGVGGRFRVGCTPLTGWEDAKACLEVESAHLTEYTADVGLYFSLPVSERLALCSKALIGESLVDGMDIDARDESVTYDYITMEGNNSVKYGTGISLTYSHKRNSSLRVFLDYDFTRKRYELELGDGQGTRHDKTRKDTGRLTLGTAYNVTF